MSEHMHNEILEQQRKARQEFLELKKMQHGGSGAVHNPDKDAIVPKTPREKIANFWFHYKWHTIAAVLAAIIVAVSVTQCATAVKNDFAVVVFSYSSLSDTQLAPLKAYMEDMCEDINGDGTVSIQFVNCSYNKSGNNGQYEYTMLTKLQAILAGEDNALLYISDDESHKYLFESDGTEGLFKEEPCKIGQNLISKLSSESEDGIPLPDNLQISCRVVKGSAIEGKKNIDKIEEQSKKIIEAIKAEG